MPQIPGIANTQSADGRLERVVTTVVHRAPSRSGSPGWAAPIELVRAREPDLSHKFRQRHLGYVHEADLLPLYDG